jgi:cephalosporin hydroxylase
MGSTWFGVPIIKYPTDLLIYQQILVENKPDLIIETGTFYGGSALYLAHICDLLNHGEVLTIDRAWRDRLPHKRITYWTGRSTSTETMNEVQRRAHGKTVMVILDSNHASGHVKRELVRYGKLVTPGQYMIVEDTFMGKHENPGPMVAVDWFMSRAKDFTTVPRENLFGLSLNPKGYLRKNANNLISNAR